MLLHKTVNQWYHIVISYGYAAIIFHIFIADFPLFIQNQFCGKTISIHIMIITYIILRKDKRCFPRWEKNFSFCDIAVFIHLCHVFNAYHDIALLIHGLRNFIKFINGSHNLIIICFFIISVKSFGCIFYQNMIKDMRHFFKWPCRTCCFCFFIFFYCILHLLAGTVIRIVFQKIYCLIIIILLCQKICLCKSITGYGFF